MIRYTKNHQSVVHQTHFFAELYFIRFQLANGVRRLELSSQDFTMRVDCLHVNDEVRFQCSFGVCEAFVCPAKKC